MNKKRIEIGMVAKRSLPIFVFTTFLFVLADSAFATGADEKSTITDNKVKKAGMALIPAPMQQQKKISGVVTDDLGEPLPGVAIQVVGTPRGVTTDVDGTYSIEVKESDKLVFTYLGMETQTIPVIGKKELNVTLKPKVDELEEVTVVAFAKQKKESVISSITSVKPTDLKVPSSNLTTSLAGRISGLIAYQRSGEPGQDNAEFFVRGVTTFGYKKDPLVLLDNNEISSSDLSKIQPDDIASFNIMKDAAATACMVRVEQMALFWLQRKKVLKEKPD